MKIGLYYGSTTCYTEMAAEKIAEQLSTHQVELHNIKESGLKGAEDYALLIFGISTWNYGELQEDWQELWDEVDSLVVKDKPVALYGLGDQVAYGEWFLDALGMLHDKLLARGATMLGYWPSDGYQFSRSQALLTDNHEMEEGAFFVGLALDDENQFDLSDERIALWCRQLLEEYGEVTG